MVSGSKPYWDAKYEEHVFGSWVVKNTVGTNRFIYDGRDFILMVYKGEEQPLWQFRFKAGEHVNSELFQKLFAQTYG